MKSVSQSCFHAEIGVNLLWILKKTRAFIVADIAFLFVNMHCGII
jgi:hypothetical protein